MEWTNSKRQKQTWFFFFFRGCRHGSTPINYCRRASITGPFSFTPTHSYICLLWPREEVNWSANCHAVGLHVHVCDAVHSCGTSIRMIVVRHFGVRGGGGHLMIRFLMHSDEDQRTKRQEDAFKMLVLFFILFCYIFYCAFCRHRYQFDAGLLSRYQCIWLLGLAVSWSWKEMSQTFIEDLQNHLPLRFSQSHLVCRPLWGTASSLECSVKARLCRHPCPAPPIAVVQSPWPIPNTRIPLSSLRERGLPKGETLDVTTILTSLVTAISC